MNIKLILKLLRRGHKPIVTKGNMIFFLFAGDPVTIAILGSAAIGAGASVYGASKQSKALEKAAESTENWQKYLIALEEKRYDEAARFRDLAFEEAQLKFETFQETLPLLQESIARTPESAREAFALAGRRGTEDIMRNLAPFGLAPGSSTAGRAVGTMQEGLAGMEARDLIGQRQFQTSAMLSLLGRTPLGVSPTTGAGSGLLSGAGQAQGNLANLFASQGAVSGGLYGSLGQTFGQLPLLYQLLRGGGGAGAGQILPASGGSAFA